MALTLLAAFMLASIGGRYTWPILPAVIAAAALFLLSGARVGADAATRSLDYAIIAALAVIGLQMAPLPAAILSAVSPHTANLQDQYALAPLGPWRPLSVHAAATRAGFALALAAAFVFWAAREAFSHGGTRAAARLVAWTGLACALVSLAQRATAPRTVLWRWSVPDPRAIPFGPFVDRNQLATWLVLAVSLVAGYLAMRVRAHMTTRPRQGSQAALVTMSDGTSLAMLGCLAAMLLTLAATFSRSGFVALVAAAVVGTTLARRNRMRGIGVGVAVAGALLAVAAWLNGEGLAPRLVSTLSPTDPTAISRLTIWRETLHIVGTFPLFGTGQGTFADAMFVSQQTARQVLFNHAHNEYLQVLTEGGIVMFAIVMTGLVLLARAAWRRLAANEGAHRYVRIGACAGLVAIAVQSVWETGLRAPANLLLAAILAALAVVDRGEASSEITPA